MANLGILARRDMRYDDAEDYLTRARTATETLALTPRIESRYNLDWYRIRYQFAALYSNWATETGDETLRAQRTQDAATHALVVARTALDTSTEISNRRLWGKPPAAFLRQTLKPFLDGTIVPSALVLIASTVQAFPEPEANWLDQNPDSKAVRLEFDAETINPWLLIAFVEHGESRPPASLYNLACFYTRTYDLGTGAKRLLAAVRETMPAERQGLINVASRDPTLEPLRLKRPGIVAKLSEMVAPADPDPDAAELSQQFDRQDRVCRSLQSEGWIVRWEPVGSRFDQRASRNGHVLLVEFAGPARLGQNEVQATIGGLAKFKHDHPGAANAQAWVIIAPAAENPDSDLADAQELGVHVWRDASGRFVHLE